MLGSALRVSTVCRRGCAHIEIKGESEGVEDVLRRVVVVGRFDCLWHCEELWLPYHPRLGFRRSLLDRPELHDEHEARRLLGSNGAPPNTSG